MKGQRVGYIRVSTIEQNIERQLENVQLDRVFVDKASGKDKNRPQLMAMLDFVREGDVVVLGVNFDMGNYCTLSLFFVR